MSKSKSDRRWGNQRKMRAKAKVEIRRRDRKMLGQPTEDSSVIERLPVRGKHMYMK